MSVCKEAVNELLINNSYQSSSGLRQSYPKLCGSGGDDDDDDNDDDDDDKDGDDDSDSDVINNTYQVPT